MAVTAASKRDTFGGSGRQRNGLFINLLAPRQSGILFHDMAISDRLNRSYVLKGGCADVCRVFSDTACLPRPVSGNLQSENTE